MGLGHSGTEFHRSSEAKAMDRERFDTPIVLSHGWYHCSIRMRHNVIK